MQCGDQFKPVLFRRVSEEDMAIHSVLYHRDPMEGEEPGELQFMELQKVGHN